jgi:hypothetical protein
VWRLNYRTTFTECAGYLRVVARGEYSYGRSKRLLIRVPRELRSRGLTRVLVDFTAVPEPVPDVERAELGELAAQLYTGIRVAVIDPVEAGDRGIESVALVRGAQMKIFRLESTAIEWLMGDRP